MYFKIKTVLIMLIILSVCISAFAVMLFKINPPDESDAYVYTLKSYRNCVALYENQELVEVYNEIVLSNLPPIDRNNLDKGISFDNKTDAHLALQDYDS